MGEMVVHGVMDTKTIKSYIGHYWLAWFFLECILVIIRVSLSNPLKTNTTLFLILPIILFGLFVGFAGIGEAIRIQNYMQKNHKDLFMKNNSGLKLGYMNGFKILEFAFSEDDFNDPTVTELKRNYLLYIVFAVIGLICGFGTFVYSMSR